MSLSVQCFGGGNCSGAIEAATCLTTNTRLDFDSETFAVDVCPTLRAGGNKTGGDRPPGTDVDTADSLIAYGFQQRIARNGRGDMGDLVAALSAQAGETGKGDSAPCVAIGPPVMAVRRLTPTECHRLQGMPDRYLAIPYRGKVAADGPQYKAIGNSMAVPCMAWIGRSIERALMEQK